MVYLEEETVESVHAIVTDIFGPNPEAIAQSRLDEKRKELEQDMLRGGMNPWAGPSRDVFIRSLEIFNRFGEEINTVTYGSAIVTFGIHALEVVFRKGANEREKKEIFDLLLRCGEVEVLA